MNQIALLIDADNAQAPMMDAIMAKLLTLGRIPIRRAFGNWRKDALKHWVEVTKRHAIKPEQQFDYVKGKNATDMALTIAAMDLLHSGLYDSFAIVSSDSDFTPLAMRLREAGVRVIGIGRQNTPEAFRRCCDSFIPLDSLAPEPKPAAEPKPTTAKKAAAPKQPQPDEAELHAAILDIIREKGDAQGRVPMSVAGQMFQERFEGIAGFSLKNYGGRSSLTTFCGLHGDKYKIEKKKGKGAILRSLATPGTPPVPEATPAPPPAPETPPAPEVAPEPQEPAAPRPWPPAYREHVVGKVRDWFREAHTALAAEPSAFVQLNKATPFIRKAHESYDLKKLGYEGPKDFLSAFPDVFELQAGNRAFRLR